jgi:hypothetical protein
MIQIVAMHSFGWGVFSGQSDIRGGVCPPAGCVWPALASATRFANWGASSLWVTAQLDT